MDLHLNSFARAQLIKYEFAEMGRMVRELFDAHPDKLWVSLQDAFGALRHATELDTRVTGGKPFDLRAGSVRLRNELEQYGYYITPRISFAGKAHSTVWRKEEDYKQHQKARSAIVRLKDSPHGRSEYDKSFCLPLPDLKSAT